MPTTPASSIDEHRQRLLQDAQEQVRRLQSPDLTKRELAEAAIEICERDVAIRQLNEGGRDDT